MTRTDYSCVDFPARLRACLASEVARHAARYDYAVSIEHEDRVFEGNEELVKRGFYLARAMLKPFIH